MTETILNPYDQVPDEDKTRISIDLKNDDKHLIQGLAPGRGILQAMCSTFFKAVAEECRAKNINNYTQQHELIAIIRRRTAAFTPEQANEPNVGRGTPAARPTLKKSPTKRAKPPSVV